MRKACLWIPILLLAILTPAAAWNGNDLEDIERGIDQSIDAMIKAIENGDVDAFVDYYTDDFILCDLGEPVCTSASELRERVRYAIDRGVRSFERKVIEIEGDHETAVEVSEGTLFDDSWHPIVQWRSMKIWKNIDGVWKIHRSISNR